MRIYIISWFGEDPVLREKRKTKHLNQVQWAIENSLEIFILNQDYQEVDFLKIGKRINYIGDNSKHLPGEARNILLEHFYSSNEDFAFFADNDTVFKNLSDFDFIRMFPNVVPTLIKQKVGLIAPINPIRIPFNKEYQEKKSYYDTHFCFKKYPNFKGSFGIYSNFRKHYDVDFFFDPFFSPDEGGLIPKEDEEFALNLLMNGYSNMMSYNIVNYEMASGKNDSTWSSGSESRHDKRGDEYMLEKHNITFTEVQTKGKTIRKRNLQQKPLYVNACKLISQPIKNEAMLF